VDVRQKAGRQKAEGRRQKAENCLDVLWSEVRRSESKVGNRRLKVKNQEVEGEEPSASTLETRWRSNTESSMPNASSCIPSSGGAV
jgi:hypothetical protein